MNRKFDFSEIDEALPAAEKMQEKDRMAGALENNYEAIRLLNANVEKLESRLSEALPKWTGLFLPCIERARFLSARNPDRYLNRKERKSAKDGRQDGKRVREVGQTLLGE